MADKELVAQVRVTEVGADETKSKVEALGNSLKQIAATQFKVPFSQGAIARQAGPAILRDSNASKVVGDVQKIEQASRRAGSELNHVHDEVNKIGQSDGPRKLSQNISQTGSAIDHVGRSLATFASGLVAAMGTSRLVGFVEEAAFSFRRMGAEVGVSDRMIQAWTDTAEQLGLEASTLVTAVGRMQDSANDIMIDPSGQTAQNFRRLGISVYDANGNLKDANELLYAAADAIKSIDNPTQRTGTAIQLFGRAGRQLVPILSRGSDELRRMNNEFANSSAGLTSSQIDKTIRASVAYNDIKDQLLGLAGSILEKVAPNIEWLSRKIEQTIPHIQKFFTETTALRAGIIALGIAAAIAGWSTFVSWVAAALPFVLIGLAVVALGLLIDDLIGTMQGADSETKRLTDSVFGIGTTNKIIDSLKDAFYNVKDAIQTIVDTVVNVKEKLSSAFTTAGKSVDSFRSKIASIISDSLPLQAIFAAVAGQLAIAYEYAKQILSLINTVQSLPGTILGGALLKDNEQAGPDTGAGGVASVGKSASANAAYLSGLSSANALGPVARPIESPVNNSRPGVSKNVNANATTNANVRIEGIIDQNQIEKVFRPVIEKAISDANNATANSLLNEAV